MSVSDFSVLCAKSEDKCLCNEHTDVRVTCFGYIGFLPNMTADTILRVRKCMQTPYAIAYWICNNYHDEYLKMMRTGNFEFICKNKYLSLLLDGIGKENASITEVIEMLEVMKEE